MTEKLIPVDPTRCQAEIKEGSFLTFGPRSMRRCKGVPQWIAVEIKGNKLHGAMSLCDSCKQVCEKQLPSTQFWSLYHDSH